MITPQVRQLLFSNHSTRGASILLSEDFPGSSVDTNKGTITNPDTANLRLTVNNGLFFTRITDTGVASQITNYWQSVDSFPKGSVVSVLMTREIGYNTSIVSLRWRMNGETDVIVIRTSTTAPGTLLVIVQQGGSTVEYSFETGITSAGTRVKIVYSVDNEISFWYWNTNQWTQMGSTQVYDLGASGSLMIASNSLNSDAANDRFNFKQLRVTSGDYATETP